MTAQVPPPGVAAPVPPELVRLGTTPGPWTYLRAVWSRREFALSVPLGELRAQNMDTVLGGLWHLLNPLLLVLVYYVVFGLILRVGERGTDNFIAFLTTGIFSFFYTRKSVMAGAKALVTNLPLIRSIRFPRAILPLSAVISETIALVPALLAMFAVVLLTGERPLWTWLLVPVALALQAAFNLGAVLVVARLTFHFHDVQQMLPYFFQIWFYLSGVFYSVEYFVRDPAQQLLFSLNPAYAFITIVRDAVLSGAVPTDLWLVATVWAVVVPVIGFWYFRGGEQDYAGG